MNIKQEYLKLKLKGIPLSFIDVKWDESPLMSFARFQRFIISLEEGTAVFAYNENGEIINRLLVDEVCTAKDIKVLDFAQYFRESFVNKESGIPTSKVMYILNVGNEEVQNYNFSDKKLFNIIQTNLQRNNIVIVVSNVFAPTTFRRNYPTCSDKITVAQQILK